MYISCPVFSGKSSPTYLVASKFSVSESELKKIMDLLVTTRKESGISGNGTSKSGMCPFGKKKGGY
jgi:hypothetical protein